MPTLRWNGKRLPIYWLPYLCFSKDLNTNICKASSCPRLVLNTRNTNTSPEELTKAANLAGRLVSFFLPVLILSVHAKPCKKISWVDLFAGLYPALFQIFMCFLINFIVKNVGLCYMFLLVASLKSCPVKVFSQCFLEANSIQFSVVQWSSLAFIEIHLFKHNVYIKLS